jgi:predicted fused transcriptional regulator/phosphomethylpyrimidine kinase
MSSNLIDAIVIVLDIITSPKLGLMSSDAFQTPIPFVGANIGQAVSFAYKIAHVAAIHSTISIIIRIASNIIIGIINI